MATHRYPRTARLNESLREVIADELIRIDDERLALVAITGIDVDPEMNRATVYYDSLVGDVGLEREDGCLLGPHLTTDAGLDAHAVLGQGLTDLGVALLAHQRVVVHGGPVHLGVDVDSGDDSSGDDGSADDQPAG